MHPHLIPDTCTTHTIGRAVVIAQECPPATERASQEIALVSGALLLGILLILALEVMGWEGGAR